MAQIGDGGDSPNTELNLVPFIDLMCVCITFLLITAVWTQVSMIELGTSIYGKRDESATPPQEVPGEVPLRLDVKDGGYVLNVGANRININRRADDSDEKTLLQELQKVKNLYPAKTQAVIAVDEHLPYNDLIQGMDQLISAGFSNIGIATGEVL